jgi:CBS domain-containing protein
MIKTRQRVPARKPAARKPAARKPAARARAAAASPLQEPVSSVMKKDVVTVATTTPLFEVERTLAEARISGVPVIDVAGRVAGVLSLKDIADRASSDADERPRRRDFYELAAVELDADESGFFEVTAGNETTAGEVMNNEVFAVAPNATLRDAARQMVRREVHRLLVLDGGRMVGIVSTMDLLRALAR